LDGSSISAGSVLRFSVTGDGVSINPETGELSLLTDSLLDGLVVTVTLGDASGTNARVFRLVMEPREAAPAPGTAPQPTAPPALEGTGEIGTVVTVDPGQWSGAPDPEIALQWCLDGKPVPGASAAEYGPLPADDGRALSCRVTARNAAGSASAETEALEVRFAAPSVVDLLADLVASEGDEPVVVEAAAAFAGDGLTFAVTGAEAAIDGATGRVTIPTASARAAETVVVTATNSGGAASVHFQVTIEARAADAPDRIPDALWSAEEVRDTAPEGRRRVSISPEVAIPAGFELRLYSGPERLASQPRLDTTRAMQPGETFTTSGGQAVGTVCHNVLFWHRLEDGVWTQASQSEIIFEIVGLEAAEPAEPLPVAPAVLSAPVLAGSGKIDSELAVDTGTWSGEPEIALQWLRDAAPIPGATAAVYVPVPEDNLTEICCRVTARNAVGETEVETEAVRVTFVAPVAVGELADEIFDEDTGIQEVPTAQAFEGRNLAFTVSGTGASVDPATGVVTIDTATPGVETVTVAAANSGGEATQSFLVTVEALPIVQPEPAAIAADLWLFAAEAWSSERSGARMSITPAAAIEVPEGYELRCYIGSNPAGVGGNNTTAALVPGTKFTTSGFFSGDVHARLFWRDVARDGYDIADAGGKVLRVAAPSVPSDSLGDFPAPTDAMLAQAAGMNTWTGAEDGVGVVTSGGLSGWNGPHMLTLALAEMRGVLGPSQRTRLIEHLKWVVSGNREPACIGGYQMQHEMNPLAMAAICRHLPIWNQLTQTERDRWDTVMKAQLFTGCYIMSDKHPVRLASPNANQLRDLRGGNNVWRTPNPNHRAAYIGNPLIAMAYFGGPAQATALLEGFSLPAFIAEANSRGLNYIRNTYTRQWGANAPTQVQIENALKGWTYTPSNEGAQTFPTFRLADYCEIMRGEVFNAFNNVVRRGGGADGLGIVIDGVRWGSTIDQNVPVPNEGQIGMGREFHTMDEGGLRSALDYVLGGYRNIIQTLLVLAARGFWRPAGAIEQETFARLKIGCSDLIWRQQKGGYRDYHKGARRTVWPASDANHDATRGLTYTWGLWTHVAQPLHEALEVAPPQPNDPPANPVQPPSEGVMRQTVTYNETSLTLSAPRTTGQYVDGTFWIDNRPGQGGVTVNATAPLCRQIDGTWRHGMCYNWGGVRHDGSGLSDMPRGTGPGFATNFLSVAAGANSQGFDGRGSNPGSYNYVHDRNMDPAVRGPRSFPAGTERTIMKAVSRSDTLADGWGWRGDSLLEEFGFYTLVNKIPPAGAFRPAPSAEDKSSLFTTADMDLSWLPNLPRPATFPDIDTCINRLRRPRQVGGRIDHNQRALSPRRHQRNYGKDIAEEHYEACLALFLNFPVAKKFELATFIVQAGLDIDDILKQGGHWLERGGLLPGWKGLHYMTAFILNDAGMKTRQAVRSNWHDTRQIRYLAQGDIGRTPPSGRTWAMYRQGDIGTPEYDTHGDTEGERDRNFWQGYRVVNSRWQPILAFIAWMTRTQAGRADALTVFGLDGTGSASGRSSFLDYVDRIMGQSQSNRSAIAKWNADSTTTTNRPAPWVQAFYYANRSGWNGHYPRVWGQTGSAPRGGEGDGWDGLAGGVSGPN
jgi:hypothetical protein